MKKFAMVAAATLLIGTGCGAKQVKRIDPDATEGVTTKWGRTDIQETVDKMVKDMLKDQGDDLRGRPVLIIDPVRNDTGEFIDTQNVTDLVRDKLMDSGRFTFTVSKKERSGVVDEIEEQDESGAFEKSAEPEENPGLKRPEYTMKGRISSIEKQNEDVKDVYYQITLQLYKIRKGVIVWTNTSKIAKQQER